MDTCKRFSTDAPPNTVADTFFCDEQKKDERTNYNFFQLPTQMHEFVAFFICNIACTFTKIFYAPTIHSIYNDYKKY